jgi:hypothetical protein
MPAASFLPTETRTGVKTMTKTMEMNGPARKTLASQLDRLDATLDGLSEGLNEAVASAVREAVGLAVQEAVQAVLTEVLTNPALRERLQRPAAPEAPPPEEPKQPTQGGGKGRLAVLRSRVGERLRSACRAGADRLRQAGQAARWAWRLAGDRVRAVLLAGAGVAAAGAAYLARTSLAAAAHRFCEGARSLASRAWGAFRRVLPTVATCVT